MNAGIVKKAVVAVCCGVFCWHAAAGLLHETKNTCALLGKFYGLGEDQKKAALFPELWPTITRAAGIIPPDANVLIRTDDMCEMLYCAYWLLPRRMYFYVYDLDAKPSNIAILPSRDSLKLDWPWLGRKRISWLMIRTADRLMRIMKITDGKILEEITFPG